MKRHRVCNDRLRNCRSRGVSALINVALPGGVGPLRRNFDVNGPPALPVSLVHDYDRSIRSVSIRVLGRRLGDSDVTRLHAGASWLSSGAMGTPGKKGLATIATTLSFDKFWAWLAGHANCILRAGTPEVVLLDHDDFHWTLITEDDHTLVVQLARAKDLVGELLVFPAEIAYVQVEPSETEGEWLFECIIESEKAREVAYHFVMAHEYEDGEHRREEKWTH